MTRPGIGTASGNLFLLLLPLATTRARLRRRLVPRFKPTPSLQRRDGGPICLAHSPQSLGKPIISGLTARDQLLLGLEGVIWWVARLTPNQCKQLQSPSQAGVHVSGALGKSAMWATARGRPERNRSWPQGAPGTSHAEWATSSQVQIVAWGSGDCRPLPFCVRLQAGPVLRLLRATRQGLLV